MHASHFYVIVHDIVFAIYMYVCCIPSRCQQQLDKALDTGLSCTGGVVGLHPIWLECCEILAQTFWHFIKIWNLRCWFPFWLTRKDIKIIMLLWMHRTEVTSLKWQTFFIAQLLFSDYWITAESVSHLLRRTGTDTHTHSNSILESTVGRQRHTCTDRLITGLHTKSRCM